ncbi:MAG: N-acetylmuramoyl-L-alanine amidase [Oscillospiraceae bacterium]|nr:N-acetylmuramoyl-L-alanine amidase [Oscillospiraceae bacterium]
MPLSFIERPIKNNQAYIKNVLKSDSRYTDFQTRGPQGAVLHSIGTPQPSAKVIGDYFDSPFVEASVHMVLQADGQCYVLAPDHYRMWHGGGSINNSHMGIEMTEPKEIAYDAARGYRLSILDGEKALTHVKATYERAVELFARLCRKYGWDPLEDGVILSHKECYERGIGSNHGDPEHLWDGLNTGYTMDTFRQAVADAIAAEQAWEQAEKAKQEAEEKAKQEAEKQEQEVDEVRYYTLGDLKKTPGHEVYLPTIEKLIRKGYLLGRGGKGDDLILDFSEDSLRLLVTLDRAGAYGD